MRIHRGSKSTRGTDRGFTTIELMVVIGIVIMLLGILFVALSGATRSAQAANTRALMNSMKTALVQFRNDIGYLPPVLGDPTVDTSLPQNNHDLRKLFDPRGEDLNWQTDADNVLPERQINGNPNGFYAANIQEWFSWTTLPEYLLGYGDRGNDGYGVDVLGNYANEQPPLGIRDPGSDGVWGATVYGAANGSLDARMRGPGGDFNAQTVAGKVYGPYLELKDDRLLACTDGTMNAAGRLNLFFPGDSAYDPLLPKVIVDYWGNPIRYYRRLYAPGSLQSPYRPFGVNTRPPTLSDVFVLRPFEFPAGQAIDGLPDFSQASYAPQGDTSTTMALQSAEFALLSPGPNRMLNQLLRYDDPDDPGNDPNDDGDNEDATDFANEDNIVELGP